MFRTRGRQWLPALFFISANFFCGVAYAQDERSVKSPDGQVEFRLFTTLPDGAILNALSYQVLLRGKPLVETSYLGLALLFQEPLLGDNVGLSADKPLHEARYNGLWADYLQTSTTGRRIQFEVRVWNDGVAFRYIVPRSPLLFDLAILDDMTQYRFAGNAGAKLPEHAATPWLQQLNSGTWVGVYTEATAGFPNTELRRLDGGTLASHLEGGIPEQKAAFRATTPWTSPWHVIAFGADQSTLGQTEAVRESFSR